jgi:uncharacterized protein YecT (DUF1311 family)
MKYCASLIATLIFASPLQVKAEEPKLTHEYSKCIERSGAVDPKILDCMSAEYIRQDKRLNQAYKKLLNQETPKRKKELQEVQRLWVKYTEANCDFYYDPNGGTLARQSANQCSIDARASRATELESLPE